MLSDGLGRQAGPRRENLFCMALIQVAGTGLNTAACKYSMCLAFVVVVYALWHSGGGCGLVLS